MNKRCVRCGRPPHGNRIFWRSYVDGEYREGERPHPCLGYVAPAPWWLKAADRLMSWLTP